MKSRYEVELLDGIWKVVRVGCLACETISFHPTESEAKDRACFLADAALGRQVREAAAALGVEPGRVDLRQIVLSFQSIQSRASQAKRNGDPHAPHKAATNACAWIEQECIGILSRLSPAPAEGDAIGDRIRKVGDGDTLLGYARIARGRADDLKRLENSNEDAPAEGENGGTS